MNLLVHAITQIYYNTLINKNSSQRQFQINMDSQCALLPNLNSYFIFMQAYQRHRRKVEEIGKSSSVTKRKRKRDVDKITSKEKGTNKNESVSPDRITLKRQSKNRLSPRANQNQYEIRLQNRRLLERIRKCHSTIDRKLIQRHQQQSSKLKGLLSRFIYSQQSQRVVLRCRQSLQVLKTRQLQSKHSSNPISRDPSRVRQVKSEASRIQTHHNSHNQGQSNSSSKKSVLTKFSLLKQDTKVQQQFQRSKVNQASKEFQNVRLNFWNVSKKRIKTDIRKRPSIFFTQLQS